jgi:hypothetical protein
MCGYIGIYRYMALCGQDIKVRRTHFSYPSLDDSTSSSDDEIHQIDP